MIDPYPELVVSKERIYDSVKTCVNSAMHFSWVSEQDGEIVGALGALVVPNMMYERSQAVVLMWYCKRPGDGVKLMKSFLKWCDSKMFIKQVQYSEELNADPRIGRLLRKMGFKEPLNFYLRH